MDKTLQNEIKGEVILRYHPGNVTGFVELGEDGEPQSYSHAVNGLPGLAAHDGEVPARGPWPFIFELSPTALVSIAELLSDCGMTECVTDEEDMSWSCLDSSDDDESIDNYSVACEDYSFNYYVDDTLVALAPVAGPNDEDSQMVAAD